MAGPYYVDVAVGDDGNAGTSEGAGNAWQTLAKAADTVAAGEKVWVKASGTYESEDGSNDCVMQITTAGSAEAPIVFEGYHTSTGDGGIVTINADPTGDQFSHCIDSSGTQNVYHVFKNFVLQGASGNGYEGDGVSDYGIFINCRFTNNGGHGIEFDNSLCMINCMSDNNSGNGVDCDMGSLHIGCVYFDNSSSAINSTQSRHILVHCLGFSNGTSSRIFNLFGWSAAINCTVDGENESGVSGIYQANNLASFIVVVNSLIYDCGTGLGGDSDAEELGVGMFNLFNSNTDDIDTSSPGFSSLDVSAGDGIGDRGDVSSSQTEAQLFTDAGNATALDRDYTPVSGSDAIGAGMDASFCMAFWHSWDPSHGNSNPPSV